ncbi:hypothetical protein Tco_1328272 [Tanacetum coccineum]
MINSGAFDVDALRSRMSHLKKQDSDKGDAGVSLRKPLRSILKTGFASEIPHKDGDNVRVSLLVGRMSKGQIPVPNSSGMADVGGSTKMDSQGDNLHTSSGELNSSSMMNPSCNQDSKGLNGTTDETIGVINSATSLGEFTQPYASTMNPSSKDTLVHEGDTNDNMGYPGPVKDTIISSGTSYDHIRPTGWSHWNDNASSIGLAGATSLNTTMVNKNSILVTGTTASFYFVKVDKIYDGVDIFMPRRAVKNDSWGRSSFARCLIEVSSNEPLKEEITIGIPQLEGDDFFKAMIRVEYERKPPRCDNCKIFGHSLDAYPRNIVVATQAVNEDNV